MTSQVLIIGAGGLVGSAVAAAADHSAVRAKVDWKTPRSAVESLRPTVRSFLRAAGPRPSARLVLWAAGRSVVSSAELETERELETFDAAHRLIIDLAGPALTFVHVSSAGALFPGLRGPAICESTAPAPISAYGRLKVEQEQIVVNGSARSGHRALILRVPTVYGPRQDASKAQGLISRLIRSIYTGSLVTIHVPRDTRRHYIWADDLGRIAVGLAGRVAVPPGEAAIRIVATDRSRTIDEVVVAIARVSRRRPLVRFMATNHSAGHGFDLTMQSEFPEIRHLRPFTGLVEGIGLLHADLRREVAHP